MKLKVGLILFSIASAALFQVLNARAQDITPSLAGAIENARRNNPSLRVVVDPKTGMPRSVRGLRPAVDPDIAIGASRSASGVPRDEDVLRAAEAYFRTGALSAAFTAENRRTKVRATRVRRDPDIPGQSIAHVEQQLDGIPVFGSSGRVFVNPSLAVTQLTTTFSRVALKSTTPSIDVLQATSIARQHVRRELSANRFGERLRTLGERIDEVEIPTPVLVIYDPALLRQRAGQVGPTRLAWLVNVAGFRIFVDAQDVQGKVLFYYLDVQWLMRRRIVDLGGEYNFEGGELATNESTGALKTDIENTSDAAQVYLNIGHAMDFYARRLGRKPLLQLPILIAYMRHGGTKFAHWCHVISFACPATNTLVLGANTSRSLDIIAHELTHGVIIEEANLTYVNESGAVNESLADIFAVLVEFHAAPGSANWVLGENLPDRSLTDPIRNMADPNLSNIDGDPLFHRDEPFGLRNRGQPDHYGDFVGREHAICETTNDYFTGCVHLNSGILNKFAFLVAEGGRHRGFVTKGIGREKLGRLAYRALTVHLNSSSGLMEAADAFVVSCIELSDANIAGFIGTDCDRVRTAQVSVGLAQPS